MAAYQSPKVGAVGREWTVGAFEPVSVWQQLTVVSLVCPRCFALLNAALPRTTTHRRITNLQSAMMALSSGTCDRFVAEPALLGSSIVTIVVAAGEAGVPLLFVGEFTPATADLCLAAQAIRPTSTLLGDAVDVIEFRRLIQEGGTPDIPILLFSRICHCIETMPIGVRTAIIELFTTECVAPSVVALSRRAEVSTRSLQRWLRRADLTNAASLLAIARLGRAWQLMRDHRLSTRHVARHLGFGSTRTMTRAYHHFLGCSAARATDRDAATIAEQLAAQLVAGSAVPFKDGHS
jgi:AraC-like DNA-binding protein